jgi:hypothetical protein
MGYGFLCVTKGKRFAYMGARRDWFLFRFEKPDSSWTDLFKITNQEEWDKVFEEYILPTKGAIEQKYLNFLHKIHIICYSIVEYCARARFVIRKT